MSSRSGEKEKKGRVAFLNVVMSRGVGGKRRGKGKGNAPLTGKRSFGVDWMGEGGDCPSPRRGGRGAIHSQEVRKELFCIIKKGGGKELSCCPSKTEVEEGGGEKGTASLH